jgi:hypothetical protein
MMKSHPHPGRSVHKLLRLIPLVALLAACDDPFGPRFWSPAAETVALFSISRTEYTGMVSAVDLVADPVRAVPIEAPGATGNWDFALADPATGSGLVLVPAGELTGVDARSRIAVLRGVNFLDVAEAPRDTMAYSAGPVALEAGVVYVVRSRRGPCGFTTGHRYAKMLPVEIDVARGIARLAIIRNPYCDDRSLIPPPVQ